ncbi:hypothetical protein [Agaribacterium sp. ZY112]|uniref:hypothetical protein n=1 Tax=Agaribacterium sp. ZY112 TaxID=3233574 RepID=UPI0035239B16
MSLALIRSAFAGNQGVVATAVGFLYFFKFFLLFLAGIALGGLVKQLMCPEPLMRIYFTFLCWVMLIACLVNLAFPGIWHELVTPQSIDGRFRLMGPFTNAGRTSWLAVVCIMFVLVCGNASAKLIALPFFTVFLYLTYVKKSFFALLLCSAIYQRKLLASFVESWSGRAVIFVIALVFLSGLSFLFKDLFVRMGAEYSGDSLTLNNSRFMLALGAVAILLESSWNLILGAGLATWGGYASSIFYSEYYIALGVSNNWGFIEGASTYTGDFYIPHVLAEVGILGTVIMALVAILMIRIFLRILARSTGSEYRMVLFFFLLLIHVLVESVGICAVEISQIAIVTAFLPGLYIGNYLRRC